MPSASSTVIFLQGLFGVLNGTANLLFPSATAANLKQLEMGSTEIAALHAIALGSISIGAFYINTAYRADKTMMYWCIVGRLLSIPIWLIHGGPWKNVAVFEGVCAFSAGVGLIWDAYSSKRAKIE